MSPEASTVPVPKGNYNHWSMLPLLPEFLENVILTTEEQVSNTLTKMWKYAYNETEQSQYKQQFDIESDLDVNIFQNCLVPVRLGYTYEMVL